MSEDKNTHKTQLWIAIIGMIGVLGTALITNWSNIFSSNDSTNPPHEVSEARTISKSVKKQNVEPFEIDVWYFPSRKKQALVLASFIRNQGDYLVNLHSADQRSSLKKQRNSTSYMYFNKDEFSEAMEIRLLFEKHLGHSLNANKADESRSPRSIRLVLSEAEK